MLRFRAPEELRRQTIACLEAGSGQGGLIFCARNAITAGVSLANNVALVNAYRAFYCLPPLAFD